MLLQWTDISGDDDEDCISVSIPQAVSAIAMEVNRQADAVAEVSIPQAVSAIAINAIEGKVSVPIPVSIPQAVSAIAIRNKFS